MLFPELKNVRGRSEGRRMYGEEEDRKSTNKGSEGGEDRERQEG